MPYALHGARPATSTTATTSLVRPGVRWRGPCRRRRPLLSQGARFRHSLRHVRLSLWLGDCLSLGDALVPPHGIDVLEPGLEIADAGLGQLDPRRLGVAFLAGVLDEAVDALLGIIGASGDAAAVALVVFQHLLDAFDKCSALLVRGNGGEPQTLVFLALLLGVGLGFAARLFQCRGTVLLFRAGIALATCLFLAARFLQGGDPDLLLALGLRRSLSLAAGFDLCSVCQILASPRIFDLSLPL